MDHSEEILNQLRRLLGDYVLKFQSESPMTFRPASNVGNFVERHAPEVSEILHILAGVAIYCSRVQICLPTGCLHIIYANKKLTVEKFARRVTFAADLDLEGITEYVESSMNVLIEQHGFPPRSNGVIVLNVQTQ